MSKKIVFTLLCCSILLSACSKKEKAETSAAIEQYRPTQQQVQQTETETAYQQQQQPTQQYQDPTQPSPDMYETESQLMGDLGSLNFSNMPMPTKKVEETTTMAPMTAATTAPDTNVSNLLTGDSSYSPSLQSVDQTTAAVETTTAAPETTAAPDPSSDRFYDENIEKVPDSEKVAEVGTVYGAYSRDTDVLYTRRENPSYRRIIEVPNVLGFSKDAYNNYIINIDLFEKNQTKLPKFSKFGYKIPYQYWYDDNEKLLNPLPNQYILYKNLFYFANEPVVDPYAVSESREATTETMADANPDYKPSVSSSPGGSSSTSQAEALGIRTDSSTEMDFQSHADDIYQRVKRARSLNNFDEKSKSDSELALDLKEIEFAQSVGLGNYYEDKVGPGFMGNDSSAANKSYSYKNPQNGNTYQLSVVQLKELLGSGLWREQNGGK